MKSTALKAIINCITQHYNDFLHLWNKSGSSQEKITGDSY